MQFSTFAVLASLTSFVVSVSSSDPLGPFSLIAIRSGTPIHHAGITVDEENRKLTVDNKEPSFVGKPVSPAGGVKVEGFGYLRVDGNNKITFGPSDDSEENIGNFSSTENDLLTYDGSTGFVLRSTGSGTFDVEFNADPTSIGPNDYGVQLQVV